MADRIDYEPARDDLYRNVPLNHRTVIPVLGIPVHFASNAAEVVSVAEEAFGAWRVLEGAPHLVAASSVEITIMVQPGDEGDVEHVGFYHRVLSDRRVLYGSRGSIAYADSQRREAVGYVTPQLVADRQHFRYALLESLTMATLTPLDRQPLHAAAIMRDDAAVLLAGESGIGKSTLAYAAARAGMRVLADDTVHLQAHPGLRIWGLPGYLHLPLDARHRFPELGELTPTLLASGKTKLSVDLRLLDALPTVPVVERAALCLVSRAPGEPQLVRVEPGEAADQLLRGLEQGFDLFADTIQEPLRLLTAEGAWRLSLPQDPVEAVSWLERLLDQLRAAA